MGNVLSGELNHHSGSLEMMLLNNWACGVTETACDGRPSPFEFTARMLIE
jgi:hypothetical protein